MSAKSLMEPPQDSMTDKSIGQPPIGTEPIPEQSTTLPYVEGAQAMISSDDEQPQPQQETAVVLAKESDAVILPVPPEAPGAENVTAPSHDTPSKGQMQRTKVQINVAQESVSENDDKSANDKKTVSSFYRNLIDVVHDSLSKEPIDPDDSSWTHVSVQ